MQSKEPNGIVADASRGNFIDRFAPEWLKPYARLARWDRPLPLLLLFWPCAISVALAAVARPMAPFNWSAIVLFLIGAIAMRGAGCTFNDIVDRDIDDKVARTRSRPIPSGQVTTMQAAVFLVAQCLVGLAVLLQFNGFTIMLGIASLGLAAIYPFMKRVTYWPQLFLGLAFSYGALMGWASEMGALHLPAFVLYAACILWTIGYDTIYALQDVEDDALIGVKSTALLFGNKAREIVAVFYIGAYALWMFAGYLAKADVIFFAAALPCAGVLAWQIITLDPKDGAGCLKRFKANHYAGLALTFALWLEWLS